MMLLYVVLNTLLLVGLVLLVRYLAIDPGFRVKTRAAGELTMRLKWGRADVIYGDIDHLGLINDALTMGGQLGHDRFNEIMRAVFGRMRKVDIALVYGGDELRMLVGPGDGYGAAERLQRLLNSYPLKPAERARLAERTGKEYISITLGVATRRANKKDALNRAKTLVGDMKPKGSHGRRGDIAFV